MFPARLAHYFVQAFTEPGQTVLDPFSGRGTTALQARIDGRRSIANDLSPLAYVLTRAKSEAPTWDAIISTIQRLESDSTRRTYDSSAVSPDIRLLFHPRTLGQLLYLRDVLLQRPIADWSAEEAMVAGAIAGILHGNQRADGTSAYLSVSMPNTFSMSPGYVKKYIEDHNLEAPDQDVFECLRAKMGRMYSDSIDGIVGRTYNRDAIQLLNSKVIKPGSVDLVLTSPPYLNVVNYGTANWIRLWWLGLDGVSRQSGEGRKALDSLLDHNHTYERYREFIQQLLGGIRRVLKPTGVAAIVIGDVTSSKGTSALASRIWADLGKHSGLSLLDIIEDSLATKSKVSRIWRETKGNATDRDRVLILGREDGQPRSQRTTIDWAEPYKEAGPDAAFRLGRRPFAGR